MFTIYSHVVIDSGREFACFKLGLSEKFNYFIAKTTFRGKPDMKQQC
jgi:hypothetical protein